MACLDTVGSVFNAERRMGIQPRHLLAYRFGHHFVAGRAFFDSDEILLRRTTERAAIGIKADDIETADQANVLLVFHRGLLEDSILHETEEKTIN